MNTMERVKELAEERHLSLRSLAAQCNVPYSTLKNTMYRGGQLTVDTIELICRGLGTTLALFFTENQAESDTDNRKVTS